MATDNVRSIRALGAHSEAVHEAIMQARPEAPGRSTADVEEDIRGLAADLAIAARGIPLATWITRASRHVDIAVGVEGTPMNPRQRGVIRRMEMHYIGARERLEGVAGYAGDEMVKLALETLALTGSARPFQRVLDLARQGVFVRVAEDRLIATSAHDSLTVDTAVGSRSRRRTPHAPAGHARNGPHL